MRRLAGLVSLPLMGVLCVVVGCLPILPGSPGGNGDEPGLVNGGGGPVSGTDDLTTKFPDCGEATNAASWRAEVLLLVNRARTTAGLPTLVQNDTLEQQAEEYACEMIHYDFFAHENPATGSTLSERAAEFGYQYQVIGENLAAGQQSPTQVVTEWMASPEHRANILDPRFTEIGIAVRSGGEYGLYWVQEFGEPSTN